LAKLSLVNHHFDYITKLPQKKKNIDEMVFKIATSQFEKESPKSICQPHTRKPNVKKRAHVEQQFIRLNYKRNLLGVPKCSQNGLIDEKSEEEK